MAQGIGKFLFFIGLITLIIFFASVQTGQAAYSFCFPGLLFLALGTFLMLNDRQPAPPSGRFVTWRKLRSKPPKDDLKREKDLR